VLEACARSLRGPSRRLHGEKKAKVYILTLWRWDKDCFKPATGLSMSAKKLNPEKLVYSFHEGNASMRALLGGKGANLAEMTAIGLPIPQGFTVTTEACGRYLKRKKTTINLVMKEVKEHLAELEEEVGKKFGDPENPLALSVRSGAAISMPGMMDTVLNLGLNDDVVEVQIEIGENPRLVYDCYRRLLQMYGDVVLGVDHKVFEAALEKSRIRASVELDTHLPAESLKQLCSTYKRIIKKEGKRFPQDPMEQLKTAIAAVFDSWNTARAKSYRRINDIPDDLYTAVNVQMMVYGNRNEDSFTGVAFTRNPSTGKKELFGEYLQNAQGEDVVAGIRTPKPVAQLKKEYPAHYRDLADCCRTLERHFREMQDLEFTIEDGTFYCLQTRNGKRTAAAAVKIAVDMVREGRIITGEALRRVDPYQLDQLLHKTLDPESTAKPQTKGLNASPGAAAGIVVFSVAEAKRRANLGDNVILVREETTPDDIDGMVASRGILTARGGMTSHAAVVARAMGKPCIAGCEDIEIDEKAGRFSLKFGKKLVVKEGDVITLDGASGHVYLEKVKTVEPKFSNEFAVLLQWADQVATLKVKANADTPEGTEHALRFGAMGIGLCRTERMFNQPERLPVVREMILAEDEKQRKKALKKLLPMQRSDFIKIFRLMTNKTVTVRLLDPPLHEFLPSVETLVAAVENAKGCGEDGDSLESKKQMLAKVRDLTEINPMLGHRGVRLGLTFPEIYKMQAQAVFEAAAHLELKEGMKVVPEIMVPQVCTTDELRVVKGYIEEARKKVEKKNKVKIDYNFGTMIEVVRACMRAGRLAEGCDFFSFGTNDLTQATFSFSREDVEKKFLPLYNEKKILAANPFQTLDLKGVGRLIDITVRWGRNTKPDLTIGICGEQGGDPASIFICHDLGLDYVSCSPFRIPIARLAAAQAALRRRVVERVSPL